MAGITINIRKIEKDKDFELNRTDIIQEMTEKVNEICQMLLTDSDKFNEKDTCDTIIDYIYNYNRILYAPISNTIYACYNEHEAEEAEKMIGTMIANMQAVVDHTRSETYSSSEETAAEKQKAFIDTKKVVIKIWDHINLAQMQYSSLKQTDEEYKKKFNASIGPVIDNITKDLNAQLLTMVGIFTALAFLIFGGISSLDNIFANQENPILKLMILGCMWGLCILNLIFVFLFCVGKMTKLKFASTDNFNATIFQKYPIVWWSNLVIVSIMILSMWGYYITNRNIHTWFDQICFKNPMWATVIGTGVILIGIIIIACKLIKATKHTNGADK